MTNPDDGTSLTEIHSDSYCDQDHDYQNPDPDRPPATGRSTLEVTVTRLHCVNKIWTRAGVVFPIGTVGCSNLVFADSQHAYGRRESGNLKFWF